MQGDQLLRSCSRRGRGDDPRVEAHSKEEREAENPLEDCNAGLQKKSPRFKIQHVNYLSKKKKKEKKQGYG